MLTRVLDIFISIFGCIVLLFMLPVIGLLIKLDSSGPIFYRCARVGKGGRIFQMFKFRTMYESPVPLGASVSPQGDPRVTPFGKILRRLKFNEFPQFINLLKGEMTTVGPRPEAPDLAEAYPAHAKKVFSIKPGLIGPNQILGRNEEEFYPRGVDPKSYYLDVILPKKLPLDLQYLKEKSFLLDLKYLFLGVWVTITGAINRQHLTDNLSQILMLICDSALCMLSFSVAHVLRFDGFTSGFATQVFLKIIPLAVLMRIPLLIFLGRYQTLIRFYGLYDIKVVFQGVTLGSIVLVFVSFLAGVPLIGYGRTVFVIDWLLLTIFLAGYPLLVKMVCYYKREKAPRAETQRILIWGGSVEDGQQCLRYLRESENYSYEVVGFIDEDIKMHHRRVDGLKVLGDHSHLEILTRLYKINEIMVAGKMIPQFKMDRVQLLCHQMGIAIKCFLPLAVEDYHSPYSEKLKVTTSLAV